MRPDHEGSIVCPKIAYQITVLGMTCRRPLTNQTSEQRAEVFPASAEPGRNKAGVGELLSGGAGISSRASQASGLPSPAPLSMKARNVSVSKPGEVASCRRAPSDVVLTSTFLSFYLTTVRLWHRVRLDFCSKTKGFLNCPFCTQRSTEWTCVLILVMLVLTTFK